MRELGIRSKLSKKFKITTDSKHNYLVVENILDRDFESTKPAQKWVSDITYIRTIEGFLYLTIVLDLYDRKVIGWSLYDEMSTEKTSLSAWKVALANRKIEKGLILSKLGWFLEVMMFNTYSRVANDSKILSFSQITA